MSNRKKKSLSINEILNFIKPHFNNLKQDLTGKIISGAILSSSGFIESYFLIDKIYMNEENCFVKITFELIDISTFECSIMNYMHRHMFFDQRIENVESIYHYLEYSEKSFNTHFKVII